MNKKMLLTAFLVAVSCQPVSANVADLLARGPIVRHLQFAARVRLAAAGMVTFGVTALGIAGYKYLTKEKVWVEGSCIKFEKRTLFGREKGFVRFKTPEEATAAYQVIETGHFFGGFPRIREAAKLQRTSPSAMWSPMPMTDADVDARNREDRKLIFESMQYNK